MSIPSDAAVKQAAENATWTVYEDSNGIARAVFQRGKNDYVTIGCPVATSAKDPYQVFVYVPAGIVLTGVEVLTFRYLGKDGSASGFRADGVRYRP
jgi:hypothetical protein